MNMATVWLFLRAMAMPLDILQPRFKWGWWVLTFLFRYLSLIIFLVDGNARSLGMWRCMVKKMYGFILDRKLSLCAGHEKKAQLLLTICPVRNHQDKEIIL